MNRYLNQPTAHSQHTAVSVTWSISPPRSQSDSTGTHTPPSHRRPHTARLWKARACSAVRAWGCCVSVLADWLGVGDVCMLQRMVREGGQHQRGSHGVERWQHRQPKGMVVLMRSVERIPGRETPVLILDPATGPSDSARQGTAQRGSHRGRQGTARRQGHEGARARKQGARAGSSPGG